MLIHKINVKLSGRILIDSSSAITSIMSQTIGFPLETIKSANNRQYIKQEQNSMISLS